MSSYKEFDMDIVKLNNIYNINNSSVEGIKYSDIMDIIVKKFDKRKEKIKEKKKKKRDNLVKNNAPNKNWNLFEMDNNTNSSEGYKNDKQET